MPSNAPAKSFWDSLNIADPTPVIEPFLAWEKLRIYYNLILAAITLGLGAMDPEIFSTLHFWRVAIVGAIGANVCFCAGPVAENYLAIIGANRGIVRSVFFGLGCLIASALAFFANFMLHFALAFD